MIGRAYPRIGASWRKQHPDRMFLYDKIKDEVK